MKFCLGMHVFNFLFMLEVEIIYLHKLDYRRIYQHEKDIIMTFVNYIILRTKVFFGILEQTIFNTINTAWCLFIKQFWIITQSVLYSQCQPYEPNWHSAPLKWHRVRTAEAQSGGISSNALVVVMQYKREKSIWLEFEAWIADISKFSLGNEVSQWRMRTIEMRS